MSATEKNVRRLMCRTLLRYDKERKKRGATWDDIEWSEVQLISGSGDLNNENVIQIVNNRPAYKELFDAQVDEVNLINQAESCNPPRYCDVQFIADDGCVPVHSAYFWPARLTFLAGVLNEIFEMPSKDEVVTITLTGVKLRHLRIVLSLLYTGKTVYLKEEEKEINDLMRMLGMQDFNINRSVLSDDDKRKKKPRLISGLRIEEEPPGNLNATERNQEEVVTEAGDDRVKPPSPPSSMSLNSKGSTSNRLPQPGTSRLLLDDLPLIEKVTPGNSLKKVKKQRIQRQLSIREQELELESGDSSESGPQPPTGRGELSEVQSGDSEIPLTSKSLDLPELSDVSSVSFSDDDEGKKDSHASSKGKKDAETLSKARKNAGTPSKSKKESHVSSKAQKKVGTPSQGKKDLGTPSKGKKDAGASSKDQNDDLLPKNKQIGDSEEKDILEEVDVINSDESPNHFVADSNEDDDDDIMIVYEGSITSDTEFRNENLSLPKVESAASPEGSLQQSSSCGREGNSGQVGSLAAPRKTGKHPGSKERGKESLDNSETAKSTKKEVESDANSIAQIEAVGDKGTKSSAFQMVESNRNLLVGSLKPGKRPHFKWSQRKNIQVKKTSISSNFTKECDKGGQANKNQDTGILMEGEPDPTPPTNLNEGEQVHATKKSDSQSNVEVLESEKESENENESNDKNLPSSEGNSQSLATQSQDTIRAGGRSESRRSRRDMERNISRMASFRRQLPLRAARRTFTDGVAEQPSMESYLCGICEMEHHTYEELQIHLDDSCARHIKGTYSLRRMYCGFCESSFKEYDSKLFIEHLMMCSYSGKLSRKINKALQSEKPPDDRELEENKTQPGTSSAANKEHAETENETNGGTEEVASFSNSPSDQNTVPRSQVRKLKNVEVHIDKLTESQVERMIYLTRRGKKVNISRPKDVGVCCFQRDRIEGNQNVVEDIVGSPKPMDVICDESMEQNLEVTAPLPVERANEPIFPQLSSTPEEPTPQRNEQAEFSGCKRSENKRKNIEVEEVDEEGSASGNNNAEHQEPSSSSTRALNLTKRLRLDKEVGAGTVQDELSSSNEEGHGNTAAASAPNQSPRHDSWQEQVRQTFLRHLNRFKETRVQDSSDNRQTSSSSIENQDCEGQSDNQNLENESSEMIVHSVSVEEINRTELGPEIPPSDQGEEEEETRATSALEIPEPGEKQPSETDIDSGNLPEASTATPFPPLGVVQIEPISNERCSVICAPPYTPMATPEPLDECQATSPADPIPIATRQQSEILMIASAPPPPTLNSEAQITAQRSHLHESLTNARFQSESTSTLSEATTPSPFFGAQVDQSQQSNLNVSTTRMPDVYGAIPLPPPIQNSASNERSSFSQYLNRQQPRSCPTAVEQSQHPSGLTYSTRGTSTSSLAQTPRPAVYSNYAMPSHSEAIETLQNMFQPPHVPQLPSHGAVFPAQQIHPMADQYHQAQRQVPPQQVQTSSSGFSTVSDRPPITWTTRRYGKPYVTCAECGLKFIELKNLYNHICFGRD